VSEAEGQEERVAIVGAGRVGTSLAVALHKARVEVTAIVDHLLPKAQRAAALSGARVASSSLGELPANVSYIILSVPDDALPQVATGLASWNALRPGVAVAHTSGSQASGVLSCLKSKGAHIASMHPIMTFAGQDDDWQRWKGSYVSLEGDEEAEQRASRLLRRLGSVPVQLPAGSKPLYHLACVLVSNYVVALHACAVRLVHQLGLDEETVRHMLAPLLAQTARNIEMQGPAQALTGPIVRGDLRTVEQHVAALQDQPELAAAYAALGRVCVQLAREQSACNEERLQAIDALLASCLRGHPTEGTDSDK